MPVANAFTYASSIMTVISFLTFVGILWWAYTPSRRAYLDAAAQLPFADEVGMAEEQKEAGHG